MKSRFTPLFVLAKQRRRVQALFLVIALTPLLIYQLTANVNATNTTTWDATNFIGGTTTNTEVADDAVSLFVTASSSDESHDDFSAGNNFSNPFAMTAYIEDGGVEINQGYSYTTQTSPGLLNLGNSPNDLNYSHIENDLLYISTYGGGLTVINTQGTTDPADDTLVTRYHTGSTPALGNNVVRHSFLDSDILYISTSGGLTVINTQGTETAADDTLVTRYHTGSTPALANSNVFHTVLDNNLLYISTYGGGLTVINTQDTETAADDTLVTRYHTGSTPELGSDYIRNVFLDNNLLYVSNDGGLSVINTQGTETASDDTLVTRYHTGSTPALVDKYVLHTFLSNNLLYISTDGGGLTVINTQGTTDPADDTLVTRYHTGSTPALLDNFIMNTFLYNDSLFLSSWYSGGLSVITPGLYNPTGTYLSSPRSIATTPTTTISVNSTLYGQDVDLAYRSGTENAVWFDDFTSTSSHLGDYYAWGGQFDTAELSASGLALSDPDPDVGSVSSFVYHWFDTGKSANYFPLNSVVTARVRLNSDTVQNGIFYLFNDDWWDSEHVLLTNNEWKVVTFTAYVRTFSKIGLELYWPNGTWNNATDSLEIDWIKITTPDSMGEWGSWNTCSGSTCVLPDLGTDAWLQYKLDLSTDDTATSPRVNKVTYQGDYESTGTYQSSTETYEDTQDLLTFNTEDTTPTGTTIAYEYSTDSGATWKTVTSGEQFADTRANSFTWRATLTTADPAYTPSIESVTLTHTPYKPNISTSLQTQIDRLEANGNQEAIARLKAKYPQAFDGTATDHEIQLIIVGLLQEAVGYLNILVAKDAEES